MLGGIAIGRWLRLGELSGGEDGVRLGDEFAGWGQGGVGGMGLGGEGLVVVVGDGGGLDVLLVVALILDDALEGGAYAIDARCPHHKSYGPSHHPHDTTRAVACPAETQRPPSPPTKF